MEEEALVRKRNKAKREKNHKVLVDVQKKLGDLYYNRKNFEDALVAYKGQLEACKDLGKKLDCAVAHRMIGEVYADIGNFKEALSHQGLYLELARELENLIEEQRAFATLGRTYLLYADSLIKESEKVKKEEVLKDANKAFSRSIKVCDKLENKINLVELMMMRARLLLNLGLVREHQKDTEQALNLVKQAYTLCKKHNLNEDLHRTNISLAGLHERMGNMNLALKHFDEAAKVDDINLKNNAKICKAEVLLRLGEWVDAKKLLLKLYKSKKLLELDKITVARLLRIAVVLCQSEDKLLIETLASTKLKLYETMGDAATAARCLDKAIYYYQQMLDYAEKTNSSQVGAALTSLSQTLRDAGRYEEAIPYARRELELCTDPKESCNSALNLVALLVDANVPRTEQREMLERALVAARDSGDPNLERLATKELIEHEKGSEVVDVLKLERLNEQLTALPASQETEEDDDNEEDDEIGKDLRLSELSDSEPELEQKQEQTKNVSISKRSRNRCIVKRNLKGESELHVACIKGNISAVEKLLEEHHPTLVRDNLGWTPLHEAANYGFVEIVRLLIKAGADVNDPGGADCDGVTPLHDAAANGHVDVVQLLLDSGADPNLLTRDTGNTALDCLQQWRERKDDLSAAKLKDYVLAKSRLTAMTTVDRKKTKKKRKSQENCNTKSALINENSEDEMPIPDSPNKSWSRPERLSAGEDYKRTIASMQHPGRAIMGGNVSDSTHSLIRPSKITAPLIDSDEMLVDEVDWLDDDIGSNQRKKMPYFDGLPPTGQTSVNSSNSNVKRKSKAVNDFDGDIDKSTKRQRISEEQVFVLDSDSRDSDISNDSGSLNGSAQELWPKKKKKPRQLNLLKQGFITKKNERSRSPTPLLRSPSPEISINQVYFEQKRRSWDSSPSESLDLAISLEGENFELKMHYRDLRKTIGDIEEVIRDKFEKRTGCRPKIRFSTLDGVCLPAEIHLEEVQPKEPKEKNRLQLIGEITQNDLPPIADRYKKICETMSIDVTDSMLKSLRSCENTSTFRPSNSFESIGEQELEPLAKCLHYQRQLQCLSLSGAILFGRGKLLEFTISRLSGLCELHLRNCDINHESLEHLQKLPLQLRVLDISYNPLGNKSQQQLLKLLEPLKKLQTLNLKKCELDGFRFRFISDSLINLDISHNPIGGEGAANFLQRQLLSLNISDTLTNRSSNVIDKIFFDETKGFSFSTLESLELCSCQATDFDVEKILSKTPNLTRIILRDNTNITHTSLCAILSHKPTLNYIDLSYCKLIDEPPQSGVRLISPQICTLLVHMKSDVVNSWEVLWQGKAKAKKLPNSLILFKPC